MGPIKCEPWEIAELSDTALVRWVRGTEVGYQRHARRVEDDVERRGHRRADLDMPDLD